MRWQTGRRRSWRRGTRRWWGGFAAGLIVIVLWKGILLINAQRDIKETKIEEIESALVKAPDESIGEQVSPQPSETDRKGSGNGPNGDVDTGSKGNSLTEYERTRVQVFLTADKRIETLPIELYVRGVIAAEMPVEFELEALKAQAIAARTYIYRRLAAGERITPPSGGAADVTDTVQNQVYLSLNKLLSRWNGAEREANLNKLNRAVEETKGQIITYKGEPIEAAFFSTSNGYTENASDYWQIDVPYLQSVASPWDKEISPRYKETVTMKLGDFADKLGVKKSAARSMRILETTEGKRIKTVAVGGKTLSGREVREKLGLASSQFSWAIQDDEITFTTFGYGHGVGMSQWGADGMAKNGIGAVQIVTHYYSGTKVEQASKLPLSALVLQQRSRLLGAGG
ncbi:stage II sporulation protein D [Paenibacillus sepulcri]|uniref:Stage II sporulation protein D n=2 Tax=Paenibacillus sepulcri TaxID=359917 RepID=A0ABS7C1S1_9BACL|nr:stage II sporulation protein D [Paenibacillus sepulcri]